MSWGPWGVNPGAERAVGTGASLTAEQTEKGELQVCLGGVPTSLGDKDQGWTCSSCPLGSPQPRGTVKFSVPVVSCLPRRATVLKAIPCRKVPQLLQDELAEGILLLYFYFHCLIV